MSEASAEPTDKFWSGPIRRRSTANSLIRASAWIFIGWGGLFGISIVRGMLEGRYELFLLIFAMIFVAPGAFLLKRRNRIAAGVVAAIAALFLVVQWAAVFALLVVAPDWTALAAMIGPLIWSVPTYIAWRAFQAARTLRRTGVDEGMTVNAAEA